MDGNSLSSRPGSPHRTSPIVEKGLDIYLRAKQSRDSLKWGSVNVAFLSILLFDLSNTCPYAFSNWYYLEYAATVCLSLSVLYYFGKYFYYRFSFEPAKGTIEQQKLLDFDECDTSFVIQSQPKKTQPSVTTTAMNASTLSWHSSFTESPAWPYNRSAQQQQQQHQQHQSFNAMNYSWNSVHSQSSFNTTGMTSPVQSKNNSFTSPYKTYSKGEVITDAQGLQKYLREVTKEENSANHNTNDMRDSFDRNSFWNYCNNAANILKTSLYQLSPTQVSPIKQQTSKEFGIDAIGGSCNFNLDANSEHFKTVSSTKLTQYVTNLRLWISATVLHRLVSEFDKIDNEFKIRGFSDIKIGSVGLERLKKTAEQQMVAAHVPSLPKVIPFLEISTNQEYLVQRIRELSKGSGINDYRWNSGNNNWDEHLPNDAAIIFQVFCAYMDSQLMPLPQPGGRAFYNRYVVWGDKKSSKEILEEVKEKSKCAILVTNHNKPKFNFVYDDKIHSCNHDRNNLFCVIIHFLIHMKKNNASLLEGVNLGRSGLNILCVIED